MYLKRWFWFWGNSHSTFREYLLASSTTDRKSLPRIDSLGSRQFLLHLIPHLSTVPSAIRPLVTSQKRTRALDVGAGIGRVTSDVLLHLVSDVVLVEPVESFIQKAYVLGSASASSEAPCGKRRGVRWKGIADKSKSVTFLQGTLQSIDPVTPLNDTKFIGRIGYEPAEADLGSGFDVIWCQWCLGHLSDTDLVAFLRRCKNSLRPSVAGSGKSVIVVKENLCFDHPDGSPRTVFDPQDSSLTRSIPNSMSFFQSSDSFSRSDKAWKKVFADAGLNLVQDRVQLGLPECLYTVKM